MPVTAKANHLASCRYRDCGLIGDGHALSDIAHLCTHARHYWTSRALCGKPFSPAVMDTWTCSTCLKISRGQEDNDQFWRNWMSEDPSAFTAEERAAFRV